MISFEVIPESIQLIKMTDQEYFSEKYREYISNSKLSLLNPDEGGSKERFLSKFKDEYNPSFEIGSLLHSMILQEDSYYVSKFLKPGGKHGLFVQSVLKHRNLSNKIHDCIKLASVEADYYSNQLGGQRLKTAIRGGLAFYNYLRKEESTEILENGNKVPIYISQTMYPKYIECMKEVKNNSKIQNLINPLGNIEVYNEYAILCEIKVTIEGKEVILKVKAKLDNFVLDHDNNLLILNDLKTTGKPVNFFMGNKVKVVGEDGKYIWRWFNGSFQAYHYYRQLALYLWLLQCAVQALFGIIYKSQVNMLVVETVPNFKSNVFPVSNKYIKLGISEFKNLFEEIATWQIKE